MCDELDRYSSLFASAQCTKHATKNGVTKLMCNPTKAEIIKRVKQYVRLANAEAVFVATDNDAMMDTFRKELKRMKVLSLLGISLLRNLRCFSIKKLLTSHIFS